MEDAAAAAAAGGAGGAGGVGGAAGGAFTPGASLAGVAGAGPAPSWRRDTLAFGAGYWRCPGRFLAEAEIALFVGLMLTR